MLVGSGIDHNVSEVTMKKRHMRIRKVIESEIVFKIVFKIVLDLPVDMHVENRQCDVLLKAPVCFRM